MLYMDLEKETQRLEELSRNPEDRERYEALLKNIRDYRTDLRYEREAGREQGVLRTTISWIEFLLRRPMTSSAELATRTLDELRKQVAELTTAAKEAGLVLPRSAFPPPT